MEENLKRKTVVSTIWASIQQFGVLGISFISNIVLARLLMPEDYGTIGMLAIFMAVASAFIDSGLGNALIQKKETTEEDYSTIFFFNLGMSLSLYLVLYMSAPAIAKFYSTEQLSDILRVYGLTLIINSLSLIQNARLRRLLNFKYLTISSLIGTTTSTIVGIYLAYNGYGVWSLVGMSLLGSVVRTFLLWAQCKWTPSLYFSLSSLKSLFGFGGYLLANSLLYTFRRNVLSAVLGKLYSSRELGMYTQAKKLEDIPVTGISSIIEQVSFPVFSKLQEDSERFMQMQRKSLMMLGFLCIPLMFLVMVIAEPVIVVLYTDKWIEATPYLQVLCFTGIFVSLQAVNANVVNAMGYSGMYFKWSVVKTFLLFIIIWLGHFGGIIGLLSSLVIYNFIVYAINALLASRFTHYTLWQQTRDLVPIFILSAMTACVTYFLKIFIYNCYFLLFTQVSLFVGLYLCACHLYDRKMISDMLILLRNIK